MDVEFLRKNARPLVVTGIILVLCVILFLAPNVRHWIAVKEAEELFMKPLPEAALPIDPIQGQQTSASEPQNLRTSERSSGVNLPVPFTSQAPHGNWEMPYQEACEEASALMAIRYVFSNPILGSDDADKALKDLLRTNETILGFSVDQTVEQVSKLIHSVDPKIPVATVDNPTIELLKDQLREGNVIIVPVAGRKLKNPFYRQPGPLYHMLVIRGYTDDGYFITNDPGTKRGENYLYPFDRMMDAMGDWNDGKPEEGKKVVLILQVVGDLVEN